MSDPTLKDQFAFNALVHDGAVTAELSAHLLADLSDAGHEAGLQGAEVEHFWASRAAAFDGPWESPFHVEHDTRFSGCCGRIRRSEEIECTSNSTVQRSARLVGG